MTTITLRARDLPQTPPSVARANLGSEYAALLTLVDGLTPQEWATPTECPGWSVRHMVAHLAGSAECGTRKVALARHYGYAFWKSRKDPQTFVDHLCASQIAAREGMSGQELVADLRRWAADAPARLESTPALVRSIPVPAAAGGPAGRRMSWFLDVINTRDVWMHRVDLARALGREREVTIAEGEAVRQVVRDLDTDWTGPALALTLTGPGGGTWRVGEGEPVAHVTEDAVDLMRLLSGRSDECALATEGDPAAADALRAARVLF